VRAPRRGAHLGVPRAAGGVSTVTRDSSAITDEKHHSRTGSRSGHISVSGRGRERGYSGLADRARRAMGAAARIAEELPKRVCSRD